MKWLELSIAAPAEMVEPLSSIFHRYARGGVAIEETGGYNPDEDEAAPSDAPVTLRAYLPLDATAASSRAQIEIAVRLVSLLEPLQPLQERVLRQTDWERAWKRRFHTFHVTRRLVVQPSWRPYSPAQGEAVIQMDPGLAFGTGHHPTTRMCLQELEAAVRPGHRVLDVGTGTGILAIAAVKMGASRVLALDIDDQAARVARLNARANGVGRRVRVVQGTLPQRGVPAGAFDLALANISASAIVHMAPDLAAALRPGGSLIVSGIVQERAEEVVQALAGAGVALQRRRKMGMWVGLVATRGAPEG